MGVASFTELVEHFGHRIVCATYGTPAVNVALECEDCCEVLVDYDRGPAEAVAAPPVAYDGPRLIARFVPQVWHGDYAESVEFDSEPAEWDVTDFVVANIDPDSLPGLLADIDAEADGELNDDSDLLRGDPAAPEWVQAWPGPFETYVRRAVPLQCRYCGAELHVDRGVLVDSSGGDGCDDTDADGGPRRPDELGGFGHELVDAPAT